MQERYRQMYLAHSRLGSFQRRIDQAKKRIAAFLDVASAPYVAWSGGKDSECLLILLAQMGRTDVPVFTQGDDLDWPEKQAFCHRLVETLHFPDYTYMMSDTSAMDQFRRMPLDGTQSIHGTFSHVVKRYVDERERNGVVMGLRSEESVGRRTLRKSRGLLYQVKSGEYRAIPIADWTGVDVFALILESGLPYMHVYDCDALCPPHAIRFSWMVSPAFLQYGHGAWLKRYYPEQFRRLQTIHPQLGAYA